MTAAKLKAEIEARRARLAPLIAELEALQVQHRDALSREWIAANGVTAAQVQRCSGDGMPSFDHFKQFGSWMADSGCTLPWCEWNGRVLLSADVMAGSFKRTPGIFAHAPA